MTPVTSFSGQKVALFGLGGSGLATVHALKAGGADVLAWDDSAESNARAREQGVTVSDLREADWPSFSALILSPGVPLTHPEPHWTVPLARAAGVEVIGDIELFCRERARLAPDAPFVAITGTNGKSTTTALIAHLLREAGCDVQMGGNIGTAILSLESPSRERVHVVELSTFQIDLTPSLDPSVGILLNLTPDHLDRHGTMENYAAIKERLVAQSNWSLVSLDDPICAQIHARALEREKRAASGGSKLGRQYPVSVEKPLSMGVSLDGTRIVMRPYGDEVRVLADVAGLPTLRGKHNAQNACFAAAVADIFEVWIDDDDVGDHARVIQAALDAFPGLPHRMEEVGRRGRVLFVNDSKATNADSTEKALTAFRDVHWIVGGKAKEGGIGPLAPLFERVAHAYLIGASSDAFARDLDGRVPYTQCGTLDVATTKAAEAAASSDAPEPVVLLSPACASYDQFRNFEERGNRFRDLVRALP